MAQAAPGRKTDRRNGSETTWENRANRVVIYPSVAPSHGSWAVGTSDGSFWTLNDPLPGGTGGPLVSPATITSYLPPRSRRYVPPCSARLGKLARRRPARCSGARGRFGRTICPSPGRTSATSTCPHCCVPIEWPDRLDIGGRPALPRRRSRRGHRHPRLHRRRTVSVSRVLSALCRRAAELGFRFDKIMTNGVWHADAAHLEARVDANWRTPASPASSA